MNNIYNNSPKFERLEPFVSIILAAHGFAMLVFFKGDLWMWLIVVLIGALGLLRLLSKTSFYKHVAFYAVFLSMLAWLLMWHTGGTRSFFLLWYFVILAIYPLLIKNRYGFLLPITVALSYLAFSFFQTSRIPLIVVWARAFLLCFIGLINYYIGLVMRNYNTLKSMAMTDDLTGVYQRGYFVDRLQGELERAKRVKENFSLVFIDLDDFKAINDKFGHDIGDKVLRCLAEKLKSQTRGMDVVGRLGGDEFAIILPKANYKQSECIIKRIKNSCKKQLIDDGLIDVGFSAGISVFPDDKLSESASQKIDAATLLKVNATDLLKIADEDMYHIKQQKQSKKRASNGSH